MKAEKIVSTTLLAAALAILGGGAGIAMADEPCGDFGECKTLIEINASDGDIGFHFLMDGGDLIRAAIFAPNHRKIFYDGARGPLREQFLTETFAESAEPLCWEPEEGEDEEFGEDFVTLEDFIDRWRAGTYTFIGIGEHFEFSLGQTTLGFDLPAAPADLEYDEDTGIISWTAGNDLGECADYDELADLVEDEILPEHPFDVEVAAWEIVLEPDVEDGDPTGALKYTVRVPGGISVKAVTVPADYLASLPNDTPVKIEVGAIGVGDNATFSEVDGFCVNEDEGCEEDED